MMRNQILAGFGIGLERFDVVVEEKIDEDGVYACVGVVLDYFAADELYGPDAGACGGRGLG